MSSAPPPLAWTLRPSLLTERMIGVALVFLTAAVGFGAALGLLVGGGGGLGFPVILVLTLGAVLLVGFKVSKAVTRGLARAGFFGDARLTGGMLRVGRRRRLDLSRPFDLEARYLSTLVRHSALRSSVPGSLRETGRLHGRAFRVQVLQLRLVQDGRWLNLIGESTDFQPGEAFSLDGLPVLDAWPVNPRSGYCRLRAADLAALLRALAAVPGCRPTRLPDPGSRRSDDPRTVYCPEWKMALATLALLAAVLLPTGWVLSGLGSRDPGEARAEAAARQEAWEAVKAGALKRVGQRVQYVHEKGGRLTGTVVDFSLYEAVVDGETRRTAPTATLAVEVDALYDARGALLPGTESPFMVNGVPARIGRKVHINVKDVTEAPPGPPSPAPDPAEGPPFSGGGTAAGSAGSKLR